MNILRRLHTVPKIVRVEPGERVLIDVGQCGECNVFADSEQSSQSGELISRNQVSEDESQNFEWKWECVRHEVE